MLRKGPADFLSEARSLDLEEEARRYAERLAPGVDAVAFLDQAGAQLRDMDRLIRRVRPLGGGVSELDPEHSDRARAWLLAVREAISRLAASSRLRTCPHAPKNADDLMRTRYIIDLTLGLGLCIDCTVELARLKDGLPDGEASLLRAFGADERCDVCTEPAERFTPVFGPWQPGVFFHACLCDACHGWMCESSVSAAA